ncbi:hypothetical protein [Nocardia alni]|uniref:hypothetical protein n=1 Tax=Nocardia alni TaxID=2815723 RepID=UPI001C212CE0|nr:hypothetical protein [Nocardia alni]
MGNSGESVDGSVSTEGRDLVQLQLYEVFRAIQTSALSVPIQNPATLPLAELDPEVLERLVSEFVTRQSRSVHFYGRRGQKQYGLDIVEQDGAERPVLYQVKRFQTLRPQDIRNAVEEYAGAPRRPGSDPEPRKFDAKRFVLVVAAEFDSDTSNLDEQSALQGEYDGDLEIDVWGAETISRLLRDHPRTVYAIFGPSWAKVWCGFDPTPEQLLTPPAFGFVEPPAEVLNVASMLADAHESTHTDPASAARLYKAVADALDGGGFPGHSARIRGFEAKALSTAGDHSSAFEVLAELTLEALRAGSTTIEWLGNPHFPSNSTTVWSEATGDQQRSAKARLLSAMCDWSRQGSAPAIVEDLVALRDGADPDIAELCCMTLENALIDGLFDFDPPQSTIVPPQSDAAITPLLNELVDLARGLTPADRVLRARLGCAIADASLQLSSTIDEVDSAYQELLDAALAGRLLHARGLVTSRAAYAYASRGALEKAVKWWENSILTTCEEGYYGDARGAITSISSCNFDRHRIDQSVTEVLKALPNREQLLRAGNFNPYQAALEYAHQGRLPGAFGDARIHIRACRLAGHLELHRQAVRLFGDILVAADQAKAALLHYISAGASDEAQRTAATTGPVDVLRYLALPDRRQAAAAACVIGEHAASCPDDSVPGLVQALLKTASSFRENFSRVGACPEWEALKALARFGFRLPESAVDPILAIAEPGLDNNRDGNADVAALLIELLYAVVPRRSDIAAALGRMMNLDTPPDELWDGIEVIPADSRAELLPLVKSQADRGRRSAVAVLVAWAVPSPLIQLVARQACAALLRQPPAEPGRAVTRTTEGETVSLLLALLNHETGDLVEIPTRYLEPAVARPAGGVIFAAYIAGPGARSDDPGSGEAAGTAEFEVPDEEQVLADASAEPRRLAAAIAEKLLTIAEDRHEGGNARGRTVQALQRLYPHLAPGQLADIAHRLNAIRADPRHSAVDRTIMRSDRPLSSMRMSLEEKNLTSRALTATTKAYCAARSDTDLIEPDATLIAEIAATAMKWLAGSDTDRRSSAAIALLDLAKIKEAPTGALYALLCDRDAHIRAAATTIADLTPEIAAALAADDAPNVRARLASRQNLLPEPIRATLAADPDPRVRKALSAPMPMS